MESRDLRSRGSRQAPAPIRGPRDLDVVRASIRAERGAHMETLAFYFPVVGPYDAILHLHWGEVILPIQIAVHH